MLVASSPLLTLDVLYYNDADHYSWFCANRLREHFPHAGKRITVHLHTEPGEGRVSIMKHPVVGIAYYIDDCVATLFSAAGGIVRPLLTEHPVLYVEVVND